MSFLTKGIQKVRSTLQAEGGDLKAAVDAYRSEIRSVLEQLRRGDHLRIFHTDRGNYLGGVLRGNRLKRQKTEEEASESFKVLVQKKYFEKHSLEVPYFRSAFNVKDWHLENTAADVSLIRMVAYEAPLMRLKRSVEGYDSRAVSCDLIGMASESCVMCIEGKVKSKARETDIVYGLLESYAYGVCVDYYLSDSHCRGLFEKELQACFEELHSEKLTVKTGTLNAGFALAAPRAYFKDYFASDRRAVRRVHETQRLLETIYALGKSPIWKGFLICEPPCDIGSFKQQHSNVTRDGEECCVPLLKGGKFKVSAGFTLEDVSGLTAS